MFEIRDANAAHLLVAVPAGLGQAKCGRGPYPDERCRYSRRRKLKHVGHLRRKSQATTLNDHCYLPRQTLRNWYTKRTRAAFDGSLIATWQPSRVRQATTRAQERAPDAHLRRKIGSLQAKHVRAAPVVHPAAGQDRADGFLVHEWRRGRRSSRLLSQRARARTHGRVPPRGPGASSCTRRAHPRCRWGPHGTTPRILHHAA